MKGGIGWNQRILGVVSDVPVSKNLYKTVSKLSYIIIRFVVLNS